MEYQSQIYVKIDNIKLIKKNYYKKIDINNASNVRKLIKKVKPNDFYHLAHKVLLIINLKMNSLNLILI